MRRTRPIRDLPLLLLPFLALLAPAAPAQEPVDQPAVDAIRAEGLEHSQVMETLSWITDVYGPRLTGSPNIKRAQEWARSQLEAWGLADAHLEAWGPFGRGWRLERFQMHVIGDNPFPVLAFPKAWSPDSEGTVQADVVLFNPQTDEDLDRFRGKLKGKIVLIEEPRKVEEPFEPYASRTDAEHLLEMADAPPPAPASGDFSTRYKKYLERFHKQMERLKMVYGEHPAAILDRSYKGDYGTIFVSAANVPAPEGADFFNRPHAWDPDVEDVVPQFTLAVEHYNRIARMLEKGVPVRMEFQLDVSFHDEDMMEHNVVAEIPGGDPELGDQVVMVGGHFDSWHSGTGATDNGAGSAVMMEVVRILQKVYGDLGRAPRRTIRIGLWSGEEQGLLGSQAYVKEHFAEIPGFGKPPTALKPEQRLISAYYNLDNGTGKIRGVYLQGNAAVAPIFRAWLTPFKDLGASTLTLGNTGGTDHLSFDAAGIPGFQFIQDPISYGTRTHHSNMDVWDHAVEDDLKQAATIIASFVYHTAERDEMLPRKPLPAPKATEASSR